MANLELVGKVTEVQPAKVYVDGDAIPGFDVTISQDGYADFCKQQGFDYYPPRVRGTHAKWGEEPAVGSVVRLIARAEASRPNKEGKVYVNLRLKSVLSAK